MPLLMPKSLWRLPGHPWESSIASRGLLTFTASLVSMVNVVLHTDSLGKGKGAAVPWKVARTMKEAYDVVMSDVYASAATTVMTAPLRMGKAVTGTSTRGSVGPSALGWRSIRISLGVTLAITTTHSVTV